MDLDVSDRVVFEQNRIVDTEPHVPPHGSSISGYAFPQHPSSRWWSYARNSMERAPTTTADKQAWTQRETVTTDGSGWWASGHAVSSVSPGGGRGGGSLSSGGLSAGGALILDANMSADIAKRGDEVLTDGWPMLTLKILGGPGTGQTRLVTGWTAASRTLLLEFPFDDHFVPGADGSILAIVGSFGAKSIVGCNFNWTEVVQWYSNTLEGVIADNTFTDCNVLNGGNVGNASLGAYGVR